MSSESETSFCSTCSESHFESSFSETSLEDEDINYTNLLNDSSDRQLFYLELIDEKPSERCQTQKSEGSVQTDSHSILNTSER